MLFCRSPSDCSASLSFSSSDSSSHDSKTMTTNTECDSRTSDARTSSGNAATVSHAQRNNEAPTHDDRDRARTTSWDPDLFPSSGESVELEWPTMGFGATAGTAVDAVESTDGDEVGAGVTADHGFTSTGLSPTAETDASNLSFSTIEWEDSLSDGVIGDNIGDSNTMSMSTYGVYSKCRGVGFVCVCYSVACSQCSQFSSARLMT